MARKLDARQAAFCRHYAIDKKSATEAAKLAGYSPHYANRQAAQLLDKPQIAAKVEQLKAEAERAAIAEFAVSKSDVRRGLWHESQNAETASARVRAYELLGKDIGMFTERSEVTLKRDPREMSKDELEEYLRARGLIE